MVIVLVGPAGCGKTTVGSLLAAQLGSRFVDADNLHSESNRQKMLNGIALSDADRMPWLELVRKEIEKADLCGVTLVVACSALKQSYRDLLSKNLANVRFVYLKGSPAIIESRLKSRPGHFFPPALLASQFKILEEPIDAMTLTIDNTPDMIVGLIRKEFQI